MDIIPTRDQVPRISRPNGALGPNAAVQTFRRAPVGGDPGGITGKDVLRILRKRMWMIILTSLIVFFVAMVITLLWWLYAPQYTAIAFLEISPPKPSELTPRAVLVPKDVLDTLLRSKATVVRSEKVLTKAAEDPRIRNTRWFQADPDNAVRRLNKEINVSPQPGTNHIMISLTGRAGSEREKTDLAEIVNAVAEAAVLESRDAVTLETMATINRLRTERDNLQSELDNVRRTAELAKRTTSIPTLQKRRTTVDVELQLITRQLVELRLVKAEAEAAAETLKQQEEDQTIGEAPEILQAIESDPQLRGLRAMELNIETERGNLLRQFGPKHRTIQTLESRLTGLREQITLQEDMLTRRAIGMLKAVRGAQLNSVTAQLLEVQSKFDEANAAVRDLEANLTKLDELARREDYLTRETSGIDRRLLDLSLLAHEEQVRLLLAAIPPREISMPRWRIMVPLGLLFGIATGLGIAFLLEFVDTSIKSPSDISKRVDLPLLGMIPHADDLDEEIEDLRLSFMTHPNSLVGEAFRQIRTCLLFSGPASQRRSLLVTSPLPEDGRTTVTMNLAAAIAHDGRKVLVVDANFRQPAIRELFPECPDGGLSSALVGRANWRDLVHEVHPNLHVLPAGMLPPNPAELLGSREMRNHITEMVEQYDQVLIDGAPCLVVTDPAILSTLVDGVVLTVRAGSNTYGIVQRTRNMLLRVGAHIMGVTLNGVRVTAGGYLRKSYETFYDYHERSQLPAELKPPVK